MFENFINQHRKLTVIVGVVITIGLLFWLIATSFPSQPNNNSSYYGVDGSGEASSSLPYQNYLYSISKPVGNTITIQAYQGYRTPAINYLIGVGVDPTDYKINFIDYTNPFDTYE